MKQEKTMSKSFMVFLVILGGLAIGAYMMYLWYPMITAQMDTTQDEAKLVLEEIEEEEVEEMVEEQAGDTADLTGANIEDLHVTLTQEIGEYQIRRFGGHITNPTTGTEQDVRIHAPIYTDSGPYPLVVIVPGGVSNGIEFSVAEKEEEDVSLADYLASNGMVAITYSPLGTLDMGPNDFQGHRDQDGLAYLFEAAKQLDIADETNVGILSLSYGMTGAAGMLARYPEVGVRYWVDWEGPSSRTFTTVLCPNDLEPSEATAPAQVSCENEAFWSEREAATFIPKVQVDYYWRIQQGRDHVQETYGHTWEALRAAWGVIPWVKLNNGEPNEIYESDLDLPLIENTQQFLLETIVPPVIELKDM